MISVLRHSIIQARSDESYCSTLTCHGVIFQEAKSREHYGQSRPDAQLIKRSGHGQVRVDHTSF